MCCNHIVEKSSNVPNSSNIFPVSKRIRYVRKAFQCTEKAIWAILFCSPGKCTLFIIMCTYVKGSKITFLFFLFAVGWLLVEVILSYSLMKNPASERHLTLAAGGRRSWNLSQCSMEVKPPAEQPEIRACLDLVSLANHYGCQELCV